VRKENAFRRESVEVRGSGLLYALGRTILDGVDTPYTVVTTTVVCP
jgi:hypothetical protein